MGERISYGPSFVPGESGIRLIQFSVADQKAVKSCITGHPEVGPAASSPTPNFRMADYSGDGLNRQRVEFSLWRRATMRPSGSQAIDS